MELDCYSLQKNKKIKCNTLNHLQPAVLTVRWNPDNTLPSGLKDIIAKQMISFKNFLMDPGPLQSDGVNGTVPQGNRKLFYISFAGMNTQEVLPFVRIHKLSL